MLTDKQADILKRIINKDQFYSDFQIEVWASYSQGLGYVNDPDSNANKDLERLRSRDLISYKYGIDDCHVTDIGKKVLNQYRILKSIIRLIDSSSNLEESIARDIPNLDSGEIYFELSTLEEKGFIKGEKVFSFGGKGDEEFITAELTRKGKVAIKNPDSIWNNPSYSGDDKKHYHYTDSSTNINSETVGVLHTGSGNISHFSQAISNERNEITKLINSLRELSQSFPVEQKEIIDGELEDLEHDIITPENHQPRRIGRRLKGLLAAGAATATFAGTTVMGAVDFSKQAQANEFMGNVLELAKKLGIERVDIEQKK